jgi:putative endonuclease
MPDARSTLGTHGETLACTYLHSQGFAIVTRNWRCPLGEIDIITTAPDGILVFVEVKTRRGHSANPLESITARKRNSLISAAHTYLSAHEMANCHWRFDVIAITIEGDARAQIDHIQDAFDW